MTDEPEGILIKREGPLFYLKDRTIFKHGREWQMPNGTKSMELNLPICAVDEFVENPEIVLDLLNAGAEVRGMQ